MPARRQVSKRVLIGVGAVALTAVATIAVVTARPALPKVVDPPPLAGTTLLAYDRPLQDGVDPGQVTYQPEGYTVFQPSGRVVQVALRCIGAGTVRIGAGAVFDFTCSDRESTFVLSDIGPRSGPFVIMGTTVGNVVWGARIVLSDSVGPRTIATSAGTPHRGGCATCSATPTG